MSKNQARMIIAYWQGGSNTDDIAAALKLSEAAVYNVLARWRS